MLPQEARANVTLGRLCHMLSQGERVTCYPGRPGIALQSRRLTYPLSPALCLPHRRHEPKTPSSKRMHKATTLALLKAEVALLEAPDICSRSVPRSVEADLQAHRRFCNTPCCCYCCYSPCRGRAGGHDPGLLVRTKDKMAPNEDGRSPTGRLKPGLLVALARRLLPTR